MRVRLLFKVLGMRRFFGSRRGEGCFLYKGLERKVGGDDRFFDGFYDRGGVD